MKKCTAYNRKLKTNHDSAPLFTTFIQALTADAMKHPEKLRQAKEVWNKEWDRLLKGVTADDKKQFFNKLSCRISNQLSSKKISEKKILDDFKKYKAERRKTKTALQKSAHNKAFTKAFRRVRREMQTQLKKRGLSYTEEQIFKMVS